MDNCFHSHLERYITDDLRPLLIGHFSVGRACLMLDLYRFMVLRGWLGSDDDWTVKFPLESEDEVCKFLDVSKRTARSYLRDMEKVGAICIVPSRLAGAR